MVMKKYIPKIIGTYLNATAPLFPKKNREQAFKILCKVNKVPVSEEALQFFKSGTTHYLLLPNNEIALHSWGSGDKNILFVHGWMSHSQRWKLYIEDLDFSEYTIYSIDAPAHGLSTGNSLNIEVYREAVSKAVEKIGTIDTMVCHSLGSLVGAYAYLVEPRLTVEKYIIMGAPSAMTDIFGYFKTALGVSNRVLNNLEIIVDKVLKIPKEDITMARFFESANNHILVIHEKSDEITPFEPIKKAAEKETNVETFFTTGQDHNLRGEETKEAILQFIKRINNLKQPLCI